jgi:site-specific recombinase XerD
MLNYNISFYLRTNRQQEDGKVPIYARIRIDDEKLELSIGQSIELKLWHPATQAVNSKSQEALLINSLISSFKAATLKAITNLQLSNTEVSIENVRKLLKGEQVTENYTLIKVTEEHNNSFEKQVGVQYSYGSYKNYKTTLAFLKEFINNQYHRHDLPLKQLNHKFCELYYIWLTTEKTSKQNGAAKHMQRLKKVLNYAVKMGYIGNSPVAGYVVKMKSVPRVALTWEEINKLQDLKLQGSQLQIVKDVFIFQIYTGLAYSDVKAFSSKHLWKNMDNKVWVRMERSKTRSTFTVPLLQPAIEILEKYLPKIQYPEQSIFPVMSNQKMNAHLKVIQEIAGISKALHTHLPRHTFATTITLMNGVPIETVSKMLGHSKITITQTYAKVGELKIEGDMLLLEQKLRSN